MSWLKKHWKWLLFPVGLLFLALTIYGRFSRPTGDVGDVVENMERNRQANEKRNREAVKAYSAKVDGMKSDALADELDKALKKLREDE